jgi:hypothetical protein
MDGVKSLWREQAYHNDRRKSVKNFLQNFKLNWLNFTILLLDYAEGISILQFKSAMRTKLRFFPTCLAIIPQISWGKNKWQWKPQATKSYVTVMPCITTNGNKLTQHIILNRNESAKRTFLHRCYSSAPKKCMDAIGVNGTRAWMCMRMLAWCIIKATEYAGNGCISWPSFQQNQK